MTNLEIRAFLDSVDAETVSPRRKEMTDRSPVKLANESALMVYRFTWTSADGARMEVQWAEGTGNPLMFRDDAAREIKRPGRFGWKTPSWAGPAAPPPPITTAAGAPRRTARARKIADFKRVAQAVADEWEAGYDDDELEELKAGRGRPR